MTLNSLIHTAIMIMFFSVIGKALGLAREVVFAAYFGVTPAAEAFLAAAAVPIVVGAVVQTAIGNAFMPEYIQRSAVDKEAGLRFANNAVGLILVLTSAVVVVGYVFAPLLVSILAPGFDAETSRLAAGLLRIMLPGVIFYGLYGLTNAFQQANQNFLFPAIATIPANLAVVMGITFFAATGGVYAAAIATLLSTVLLIAVQWPGLKRCGYRFVSPRLRHADAKLLLLLLVPVMLVTIINSITNFTNSALASLLGPGNLAVLNYAQKIINAIIGLIIMPIITVAFPTLAAESTTKDPATFAEELFAGLKFIFFVTAPIVIVLMFFSDIIVQLLLQRGSFSADDTQQTALSIIFFAPGIIGMSLLSYFTYACYARKLWQAALYSGAAATVLHFILGLVISQKLGHSGLALATTLAKSAGAAGLFWLLARHAKRSQFSQLAGSIIRSLAAAAISCIVVYLILSVNPGQAIAAALAAIAVYFTAAMLMRSQEAAGVLGLAAKVWKRVKRG